MGKDFAKMFLHEIAVFVLLLVIQYGVLVEPYDCHDRVIVFDASTKGEIKSPGYDEGHYSEDVNCEYKIVAPLGYRIKLTFKDIDIDPTGNCAHDKLDISGQNQESKLGTFCGQVIPYPIISNEGENEIEMTFHTDDMVTGRGFHLVYEAAPDMELCGRNEYVCRNRNCYKADKGCDGVDDCGDGTDEENCGRPVEYPSSENCGKTPITPDTIFDPQQRSSDRQVGGVPAIPNSWPWQVSLQYQDVEPNGHYCGGTLISPQWVVSAAHCVGGNKNPSDMRIVLGGYNKYTKTKYEATRVAQRIISYPDLEGRLAYLDMRHDLSLIKLNAPVSFNDGIQPACLPDPGTELNPGLTCYSTGWGETRGSGFSDVLKQTEQIIQPKNNCSVMEDTQICVDKAKNSPCHGDSGGPLVCLFGDRWFVMGATSFGTSGNMVNGLCAVPDSRIIFSKVSAKIEWIRKIIERS